MIRISTSMIFDQGVFNMQNATSALLKTQNQISTGRRILTPADDPVAAARSLEVDQSKAITDQYGRNADSATSALGLSDNALAGVTTLIQNAKTLAVNAGDGSLTQSDLTSIATSLRSGYQQLIGLANSTDGNGQYLYSGFQGSTQPFAETSPGVVAYQGDQGARLIQISASRQVPASDAGSDVFQAIRNGNGTFTTAAAGANTGTGVVSPGTVTNAVAWNAAGNPKDFTIKFNVDSTKSPPVTTYDIVNNATGNSLLSGAPSGAGPYLRTYTDGGTIALSTQ
jgi:flagellar hook-associated protein 3 FlgL